MKRLDELEEYCNKYKLRFPVDAERTLKLIKTIRAQHEALKWYSDNGNHIDLSYIKDETLVNLWKDISATAKSCIRQTEKEWGTDNVDVKSSGEKL